MTDDEIVVSREGGLVVLRHSHGCLRLFGDGTVEDIEVDSAHRRRGIGTALWGRAVDLGLDPKHSPERTDDGDAWAQAIGGHLPPREIAENW